MYVQSTMLSSGAYHNSAQGKIMRIPKLQAMIYPKQAIARRTNTDLNEEQILYITSTVPVIQCKSMYAFKLFTQNVLWMLFGNKDEIPYEAYAPENLCIMIYK